jgi:hypothetical protein
MAALKPAISLIVQAPLKGASDGMLLFRLKKCILFIGWSRYVGGITVRADRKALTVIFFTISSKLK